MKKAKAGFDPPTFAVPGEFATTILSSHSDIECRSFQGFCTSRTSFHLSAVAFGSISRMPCPHGKRPSACSVCSSCPHGRRRCRCTSCDGSSICPHGSVKYGCVACARGGAGICAHHMRRSEWVPCSAAARAQKQPLYYRGIPMTEA
jgi:hypothetical protein